MSLILVSTGIVLSLTIGCITIPVIKILSKRKNKQ